MAMARKPKPQATGTITLLTPEPITKDTLLDWSWSIDGLSGQEYPMVIVDVQSPEGDILFRRLDHPDVKYRISDGSCPWTTPTNPHYGQDGIATVQLWVYGSNSKTAPEYMVTKTQVFPVLWG